MNENYIYIPDDYDGCMAMVNMGLGKLGETKLSFVRVWRHVLYLYANGNEHIEAVRLEERPHDNTFTVKHFGEMSELNEMLAIGVTRGVLETWIGTACHIEHARDMTPLKNILKSGLSSLKTVNNWYCMDRWNFDLSLQKRDKAVLTWAYTNEVYESLGSCLTGETRQTL